MWLRQENKENEGNSLCVCYNREEGGSGKQCQISIHGHSNQLGYYFQWPYESKCKGKKIIWYSQWKYWIKRKIWQQSAQTVLYPWTYRKAVCYWCYAKRICKKKKKRHRLEAKSTQSLKWHSRENRGKNKDGGTTQRKIKKHDKQKLMQKNTARYWTCAELEPKCSINFFQYTEFVQSCFSQDRKIYKQQTTRVRISSSFLGHLQHSHSAWYHLVAATQHF